MKAAVAVVVVFAILVTSLGIAGVAAAQGERDLVPVVERGVTDRLGGGEWISVRAGDARVGVIYGTPAHPNTLYVFAEYKRFLGGADIYDSEGNHLATRSLPVYTIFGQSFDGMVEFEDRNGDGLINYRRVEMNDTSSDMPVKALRLLTAMWTATEPTIEEAGGTVWVNFTVSTESVPYGIVWDPAPRQGRPSDGVLDRLAFTFHLKVDIRDVRGEVPWWRVTVDETTRQVLGVERLADRNYSGQAVAMGAKYDHDIQGWDFASAFPANRLALETRAFVGNYVPGDLARLIRAAFHSEATDESGFRHRENETVDPDPQLLTRDFVYFNDEWYRVGRLVWVSDVVVDSAPARMLFQVQGGEGFGTRRDGAAYSGFAIRGAYIYPAGASIYHDPGLDSVSALWDLQSALNLTPFTVLALQIAIAGIAMGPAVLLRARGRRAK